MVKEAFTEVKGNGRIRAHLLDEKWKKRYSELKKETGDLKSLLYKYNKEIKIIFKKPR